MVRAALPSPDGSTLAVCTTEKECFLLSIPELTLICALPPLPKKLTALAWTPDSSHLLVADKVGDCYDMPLLRLPSSPQDIDGALLVGHLGAITSMAFDATGRFLVSADRDEKIRISRYPNSYHIEAFAMGHTNFVTSVALLHGDSLLLSTAADGTARLWSFPDGKQLDVLSFADACYSSAVLSTSSGSESSPTIPVVLDVLPALSTVAVKFEGSPKVLFLRVEDRKIVSPQEPLALQHEPFSGTFLPPLADGSASFIALSSAFPRRPCQQFARSADGMWRISTDTSSTSSLLDTTAFGETTEKNHTILQHELSALRYQKFDSKGEHDPSLAHSHANKPKKQRH